MTNAAPSKYRVVQWWRNLSDLLRVVVFAGLAIIFATIIFSGFFAVVPQSAGGIYVVNKYTGSVTFCIANTCRDAPLGKQ